MECYQSCALPPLPHYKSSVLDAPLIDAFQSIVQEIISGDLQQRLQKAMDAILESWSARHDSLIDQLNLQVEVQRTLQSTIETQALRYQKAVRETYFYQTKYEQAANAYARMKRRQNDRRNSYNSYESCVSSLSSYSTMGARSRIYSEDDDDSDRCTPYPSSLASPTLSLPPISPLLPLPSSPSWLDQVTPLRPDSPTLMPNFPAESNEDELPDQGTPPEQEENGSLQFACGDGFWDTIARGKGEKEEVDRLIRYGALTDCNYLRRGGRPNVAKISATVKSVKEGYSLIHALIAIKNTSALQRVIEAGANPNVLPLTTHANDKISPLVLAAKIGYLNGVRLLLERTNADILSRGPQQETALHAAVEHDNPEIVTYLIRQSKFTLLEQVDAAGKNEIMVSLGLNKLEQ
ncbi:uncharacterized protein BYT42DRAFT_256760 [Radiomyces spectabilis]|uniref:uncharacterized protein n=1 Tax=Radiomyces spectabilis TaxID=64574 RepID=UPI00221F9284|nr:uncharacterized protein BYT42DRAFT_256760 [Radiomyces spectabilis]KAI8384317.1 hypothetical protein BYT42DRAFT_256760 [Radiomyces spectabilis]